MSADLIDKWKQYDPSFKPAPESEGMKSESLDDLSWHDRALRHLQKTYQPGEVFTADAFRISLEHVVGSPPKKMSWRAVMSWASRLGMIEFLHFVKTDNRAPRVRMISVWKKT